MRDRRSGYLALQKFSGSVYRGRVGELPDVAGGRRCAGTTRSVDVNKLRAGFIES